MAYVTFFYIFFFNSHRFDRKAPQRTPQLREWYLTQIAHLAKGYPSYTMGTVPDAL